MGMMVITLHGKHDACRISYGIDESTKLMHINKLVNTSNRVALGVMRVIKRQQAQIGLTN